ncbi:hypothetical protein [Nostoc flagelliforme]|uniref:hypothetical protein n=1 Tax=Nostoc flagelliforme TaxID=1306274 RepID=UPI00168369C4|nr:hypothetical protein [Nostoc flagelliforme]
MSKLLRQERIISENILFGLAEFYNNEIEIDAAAIYSDKAQNFPNNIEGEVCPMKKLESQQQWEI